MKDPRIDAYIEKAPTFAQPILKELRKRVHARVPDAVETIKWSRPISNTRAGARRMAAFKQHCGSGFGIR